MSPHQPFRFDVVTLGETMLRFTPPHLQRCEQASSFEVHVGGSESNTAVGLSRLGLNVAWLSRLTDNPLGHMISRALNQQAVDTSGVVWTEDDRVGLYFLEEGKAPRGNHVIYDRKGSAFSRMQPEELPVSWFQPQRARVLHTTGISLGLSSQAAATTERAMDLAKQAGWIISFDVNYRGKLWSPEAACSACEPIIQQADLVFIPLRDARIFYGLNQEVPAEQVLESLAARFPTTTLVMTMGSAGAMATIKGQNWLQPAIKTVEVGRLGGGDAFSAGFLYGYLKERDIEVSLRWAVAAAALKYSIPGDLPLFDFAQVAALAESKSIPRWR